LIAAMATEEKLEKRDVYSTCKRQRLPLLLTNDCVGSIN
jgi:hypothetical protein